MLRRGEQRREITVAVVRADEVDAMGEIRGHPYVANSEW
jgi:hypothetical protein